MVQSPVIVRVVRPDEIDELSLLAVRTFPLACPPHTTAEDIARHVSTMLSPRAFAADLASEAVLIEVADSGDSLVGFTMLVSDCPPPDGPSGARPMELRRIYVDQDWHGTGVGHLLMASALDRARALDHDQVWLGTNQMNTSAIAFYRREGFQITGSKTFRVGGAVEHDHVLTRGL